MGIFLFQLMVDGENGLMEAVQCLVEEEYSTLPDHVTVLHHHVEETIVLE